MEPQTNKVRDELSTKDGGVTYPEKPYAFQSNVESNKI